MRNLTIKPIHTKPSPTNSFKKSDRSYPAPKKLDEKKMMEIEPVVQQHFKVPLIISGKHNYSMRYHFLVQ